METNNEQTTTFDKTEHHKGDIYFGYKEARNNGMAQVVKETMSKNPSFVTAGMVNDDPFVVDKLNELAGISTVIQDDYSFQNEIPHDAVKEYFSVIDKLKNYVPPKEPNIVARWKVFLRDHIDYVKIDKQIEALKCNDKTTEPSKDRFTKNNECEFTFYDTPEDLKKAIIATFENRGLLGEYDFEKHAEINKWIEKAYIRRICKLGVGFVINEGKILHFNTFSNNGSLKDDVSSFTEKKYMPITMSEYKHLYRLLGADPGINPQVDLFNFNPQDLSNRV